MESEYWIKKLGLHPHPEGGYFKEIYRSDESVRAGNLPERFSGKRNFSTSIYFLLSKNEISKLHRIKSDEIWHYYSGSGIDIHQFDMDGNYSVLKLGKDTDAGESFQVIVKAGNWFGAKVNKSESYCLAGCTVSPGFHFDDFEFADREELLKKFPVNFDVILELT